MEKEAILKKAIQERYRSVRAFCLEAGIPYSTLATAFERGIDGMAYGTVMLICEKLKLNPIDFSPLDDRVGASQQMIENEVMNLYLKLNNAGRERVLDYMQDYLEIPRYIN